MRGNWVLRDYIEVALGEATYEKLEDGSFAGRIPSCVGVVAFAPTLAQCADALRSTLEEWVLLGLKIGHSIPALVGMDPSPQRGGRPT